MTSDQSLAGLHPWRIEKTIHNIVYTIKWTQATLQATSLNIHGFTTSDQSLAGSHTLWIKGQKVKIFWHQSRDAPSGGGCVS